MKKTIIILITALILLSAGLFFFLNNQRSDQTQDQLVLEQTLSISSQYASLRYQTERVLLNVTEYSGYDAWSDNLSKIIKEWEVLEEDALALESSANEMAEEKLTFNLTRKAFAYNLEEADQVISSAPPQKRIATLAKYYGVDAKMAQLILNQTADQMSSEAFRGEGDVFEKCEQNSMRIKNGAKVTVFVGTVVATGGASAFAASGALAQTAVVVSGADLVLEVTDDEARIALGDKNKVSSMVSKMRTVTEPAAGILAIANIPGNVSKAIDKLGIVNLGADQIRSVVQDEKILGISIKIDQKGETKTTIASLSKEELAQWKEDNNAPDSTQTAEEIIEQAISKASVENTEEKGEETESAEADQEQENTQENTHESTGGSITAQGMAGTYSGSAALQHVEEDVEAPDSIPVTLQLNEAGTGTANVNGYSGDAYYAGNKVGFSVTMKDAGAVVNCKFEGRASKNGGQTVISGNIYFSMMGVTFSSYSWSAQN
ncbi:MAG: hypothetical protein GX943_00130 [Candidatus Pacebacteria bacterium]|jgi:hypothetical protein|nr:hypothetical protein [Candidatus Paceibacterota bacterium]